MSRSVRNDVVNSCKRSDIINRRATNVAQDQARKNEKYKRV